MGNAESQQHTVRQAAKTLNVADTTIRKWIAERRLGHVRLGRAIRIPSSELERFVREGFVPPVVDRRRQ
jgi:excisionase family DNA binding protein